MRVRGSSGVFLEGVIALGLCGPDDGLRAVAYPGIFFGGGVQQIQLRTEDRENGDLGT